MPFVKRINRRFTNAPGSDKIRFANTQGNDIVHGTDNVKKITDAAARQGIYMSRDTGFGDPAGVTGQF